MHELARTLTQSFPTLLGADEQASIARAVEGADLAWAGLILIFPAVSAILCGLCAVLKVKGKLPGAITAVSLLAAFVVTFLLYWNCPTDAG